MAKHGERPRKSLSRRRRLRIGRITRKKLTRFSVSFICIFVPMLLICSIIAKDMQAQLIREEHTLVQQRLESGAYALNRRYGNYLQTALDLQRNAVLSPRNMQANGQRAMEGLSLLSTVNQANGFCYDMFLFYGEGKLYSSKGLMSMESYFDRLLMCDRESSAQAQRMVKSPQAGVCPLYTQSEGYFLLHVPSAWASVNFIIPLMQLPEVMKLSVVDYATYLCFSLPDGQAVWFQGEAGKEMTLLPPQAPPPSLTPYTLIQDTSGPYGLVIGLMYRTDQVFGSVSSVMVVYYLLIALGAVLSLMASWLFSRRHWRRIRQLGTGQTVRPNRWFEDEYSYIQGVMDRQNHASVSQLKAQHALVRNQAMTMLLHGLWNDRASLQKCGIELSEDYYCVGGMLWNGEAQQAQALMEQVGLLPAMQLQLGEHQALFFLMEIPNEDESKALRREKAGRLATLAEGAQEGTPCIVLSQVYQHLSIAGYAFTEAQSMLERALERPGKRSAVVCWEETAGTIENVVRLDQDDLDAFIAALEKRSQQKATALLQKLLNFIATRPPTEENRCYLRYCLLQPILWAIGRSEYDEDTALIEHFGHLDMSDGQQFISDVSRIVQSYCANLPSQSRFDKAMEYVQENFCRYDLSLEELADQVGISKNYMSRMFKQNVGTRYIDYVTSLRMEKARELLVTTDLSVAEIFEKVGYLYKNSYSAKFKSFYGMNASEYRRLYKEQKSNTP